MAADRRARELGHNYVGTEHLLLGIYDAPVASVRLLLEEQRLSRDQAEAAVARRVTVGSEKPEGELPFTPSAARTLQAAIDGAIGAARPAAGAVDLLVAMADDKSTIAGQILAEARIDVRDIAASFGEPAVAGEKPRELANLPIVIEPSERVISQGRAALDELFAQAAELAEGNDRQVELDDVLLALTKTASASRVLAEMGVDEAKMSLAIETVRGRESHD